MVHNPVAKVSRKNFPQSRLLHAKANRAAGAVSAALEFLFQFQEFRLKVQFKLGGVMGSALVLAAIKVGAIKILKVKKFTARVYSLSLSLSIRPPATLRYLWLSI